MAAGVRVTAKLTGVDECLDELAEALGYEGALAVERCATQVAGYARAEHPYTDRTGALTASLEPLPATGSLLDGTLEGAVVAGREYASYIEEGTTRARPYPYLEPAARASEPVFEELWERGFVRAAHTAGWGT